MPSNKFFGKSKEDLVLLATLGQVLTPQQAEAMSPADLAAYLYSMDEQAGSDRSTDQITVDREKTPLMKRQTGTKGKPTDKLSKKELNKQQFLLELAGKSETLQMDAVPVSEPVKVVKERKTAAKKTKSAKTPETTMTPVSIPESTLDSTPDSTSDVTTATAHNTTKVIIIPAVPPKKTRTKKVAPAPGIQADAELPAQVAESAAEAIVKTEEASREIPGKRKPRTVKKAAKTAEPGNEESLREDRPAVQDMEAIADAEAELLPDPDAAVSESAGNEPVPTQPIRHHRHIIKIPTATEDAEADSTLSEEGEKRKHEKITQPETLEMVEGALEIMPDGYGFLRKFNYLQGPRDIYIPPQYIRRFGLRPGDWITGPGKLQRETDRYQAILYIKEVNGLPPEKMIGRPQFDQLTPIYPDVRYVLETVRNELSTRIIDLVAPIGKGQRGMIVSPPKAGKTILLQKIANAIATNNPEAKLIVLLIDERPEEVTDMQRSIHGEVVYSTFDKTPENHVKIVELVLERAMRLVELGQDVVILLDSITRLARAYNLTINPTGRTLSGGLDPGALYGPKRFFGSARNIENGGSLTIIATSLIDTGSRMDEVIFEEFKGTGNMEVYLDRKLSEKRIFPAIDLNRSGTRREELLLSKRELDAVWTIRKAFGQMDTSAVTEMIINLLLKTNNNSHFVSSVNVSLNDKAMFDAMRGPKPSGSGQGNGGGQGSSGGYGNSYGN